MNSEVEEPDSKHLIHLSDVKGQINFEQVSFKYKDSPIESLKAINLTIKPGEKVAIIGRTGSGKSTLLKCLTSLYEPQQG